MVHHSTLRPALRPRRTGPPSEQEKQGAVQPGVLGRNGGHWTVTFSEAGLRPPRSQTLPLVLKMPITEEFKVPTHSLEL